jgi:hypothetical protein
MVLLGLSNPFDDAEEEDKLLRRIFTFSRKYYALGLSFGRCSDSFETVRWRVDVWRRRQSGRGYFQID